MRKYDLIEACLVIISILFMIVISLYHLSFEGSFGISAKTWNVIWAFAENGLALSLCVIISLYFLGIVKLIFRYVFAPYFAIKLLYHFTCLSGVKILPAPAWEVVWSFILVILFIVTIIYLKVVIHKK